MVFNVSSPLCPDALIGSNHEPTVLPHLFLYGLKVGPDFSPEQPAWKDATANSSSLSLVRVVWRVSPISTLVPLIASLITQNPFHFMLPSHVVESPVFLLLEVVKAKGKPRRT